MTAFKNPDTAEIQLPSAFVWLWLGVLTAVAVFIRVHGADAYYLSADEMIDWGLSQGDSAAEVWQFSFNITLPPLGNFLLHYWTLFSNAPGYLRSESLVLGIGLMFIFYALGKRLHGQMCGLCCAALIAFSNGCIIHSYLVRNYMLLLDFLSLGLYCYLIWCEKRSTLALFGYGLCGGLAAFTHFSAIFCIFCIAAYESLSLLRRKAPLRLQAKWALTNIAVAAVAVAVYYFWQAAIAPFEPYFAIYKTTPLPRMLLHMLFYPLVTAGYILPVYPAALVLLISQGVVALIRPRFIRDMEGLGFCMSLSVFAYALGMLLVISRLYPEGGPRHNMWVLPLVIPAAGWLLADACEWLAESSVRARVIMACLLIAAGCLMYNAERRFGDSEYVMPEKQWEALRDSLATLTSSEIIFTEKDDGSILTNLYHAVGEDAVTGAKMASVAPYRNTRILFNPYYPRYYSRDTFLATLDEVWARRMLDGVQRFIFLRLAWSRSPVTDLMLCDALDKQIMTFPSGKPITREGIYDSVAALMFVPREAFVNDVLKPGGKARRCLDGKHDMVPGFAPVKR